MKDAEQRRMVVWKFDTGLKLNLLQEFYFIPLDIFFQMKDNKRKTIRNEGR